ncbi:hypothetical protein PBI_INGRID_64 [Arthrobacter phage Ingrid]|nr:hypothetical protein PBI_INGRID_64 [Arthrobacter phage Ingrid]QFG11043.1 hypothetical protein PBI_LORETTA_61 [Arthrobacter phage Loretta]
MSQQEYTFTNGIPIPVGGFKKERVALTLNGEKIGHAEVSNSGLLTAIVNSDAVSKLPLGTIESLSISVNIKE